MAGQADGLAKSGRSRAARRSPTLLAWLRCLGLASLFALAPARASQAGSLALADSPSTGEPELTIAASARVDAPPEQAWQVLTDFGTWAHFLPNLESVRVHRREAAGLVIEQTSVRLGREIRTTSTVELDAERRELRLALDPSAPQDVAAMTSRWIVSACPDGGARVELRLRLRSGHPVPRFVEKRIAAAAVLGSVEALAAEVTRRAELRVAARTTPP